MNSFSLYNKAKHILTKAISSNPLLTLSLGICSSLAVTNQLKTSFFMSIGVCFTSVFSSLIVSSIRNKIPAQFRLIVFMLVISTFVIVFEKIVKVLYPSVAYSLGAYIGLIITNCIILGNIETLAIKGNPTMVFYNTLISSISFGSLLMLVAIVREVLGYGSIFGVKILSGVYEPSLIFITPAGAFLVLAVIIYILKCIYNKLSVS